MQTEAMLMKFNLFAALVTLNALLRQVSSSLPKIHQAAGGLLQTQKEGLNGTGVRASGLAKANM